MKTHLIKSGLLAVGMLCSSVAFAEQGKLQLGLSGGKVNELSTTKGVELGYRVDESFRISVGYSQLTYDTGHTVGTIRFTDNLDQDNLQFKLDWYPWEMDAGVYTSLALVHLNADSRLSATPAAGNYTLNGTLYNAGQLGTLSGKIKTRDIVPYVGVGYTHDFSAQNKSGAFVQLEAGGIFGLDPQIELNSSNSGFGTLATDLQVEADQQEGRLDDYYYTANITVGYRF